MNICTHPGCGPQDSRRAGFTLIELLVVIAIIAILAALLIPVLSKAKTKAQRITCMSNEHQMSIALFVYGGESQDKLPDGGTGNAWNVFDLVSSVAQSMLNNGVSKKTFYCPSTAPEYDDNINFANPNPNSLWFFTQTTDSGPNWSPIGINLVGYALTFPGMHGTGPTATPFLIISNINTTLGFEKIRMVSGATAIVPNSDRVLFADNIISQNNSDNRANLWQPGHHQFYNITGGYFSVNGKRYPHLSSHLNAHSIGGVPEGGFLTFKDGHTQWRKFEDMEERATGSSWGWWW